ncbi:hypothetical protein G6F22_017281 [Rhizopus arrhizus]|nr:hypothetical protein G6F22_017281 [Rhizopus arrhizus]
MWRHAFKNSFGPTWTLLGLILGNLLAGIAVIETVFTIPGLGRLLVDAIFARDYPVIQGCLLFIATVYVLGGREMNRRSLTAVVGGTLVAAVVITALVALCWTPYDPLKLNFKARLAAPSLTHLMGTDELGRDVFSRLMRGTTASLRVSLMTVLLATGAGVLIGAVSGYLRGWPDRVLMALNDALLAFPGLLLALGLLAVFGASETGIILALALAYMSSIR